MKVQQCHQMVEERGNLGNVLETCRVLQRQHQQQILDGAHFRNLRTKA